MKGIVFNLLNDMVENKFGMATWDQILASTGLDGVYVSVGTYPDEELLALVNAASSLTNTPPIDLVRSFGEFMIGGFKKNHSLFFDQHDNLRDFLLSVDQVIHVEVRKLHPEAILPEFQYDSSNKYELTMIYRSARKLCALAEGLILGAAREYDEPIQLSHETCMHHGAGSCELKVQFHEQSK